MDIARSPLYSIGCIGCIYSYYLSREMAQSWAIEIVSSEAGLINHPVKNQVPYLARTKHLYRNKSTHIRYCVTFTYWRMYPFTEVAIYQEQISEISVIAWSVR